MAWGLLVPGFACELHRFRAGLFVGRGHPPKRPLETVPGHGNGCRRGPGQPSNLLCLSTWLRRGLGSVELAVDLAGEVALDAAADLSQGASFSGSFLDVGAGPWVRPHASHDGHVQ